jgi:hypothetical protein
VSEYLLIVDSECARCSEIGHYLAEHTEKIAVMGEEEAKKAGLVSSLAQPTLLRLSEHGQVLHSYQGYFLRLKVAQILGIRKVSLWPRFAFLEAKATDQRSGVPLRRRTLILGSLAAAVGTGALGSQPAAAAGLRDARPLDVSKVLAGSQTAKLAHAQHGGIVSAETVMQAGEPVTVLYHDRNRAITILNTSVSEDPAALRLRPTTKGEVSYELVTTGDVLGRTGANGRYVAGSQKLQATTSLQARPSRAKCAAYCVAGQTGPKCRTECERCGAAILQDPTGGTIAAFGVACLRCYACAGLTVYSCVKDCFR